MWKEYKNTPLYINKERKSDCGIMWKGGEFDGDSPEYGGKLSFEVYRGTLKR